ncbi:MAG TPA: OB-fold nucleic acid binding domain-containing protein, partial [Chitinophagaceae bacterium]
MSKSRPSILETPVEYLKGVGPLRADMLKKELEIFTFGDLLDHFPYRHVDRTRVSLISEITPSTEFIQVAGRLTNIQVMGARAGKRLVAQLEDRSGILELAWFQGVNWVQKHLVEGRDYLVFGRTGFFNGRPQMVHPELEVFTQEKQEGKVFLEPIYPTTEKLKARSLSGKMIGKLTFQLLSQLSETDLPENLPPAVIKGLGLVNRYIAYRNIHFPQSA